MEWFLIFSRVFSGWIQNGATTATLYYKLMTTRPWILWQSSIERWKTHLHFIALSSEMTEICWWSKSIETLEQNFSLEFIKNVCDNENELPTLAKFIHKISVQVQKTNILHASLSV